MGQPGPSQGPATVPFSRGFLEVESAWVVGPQVVSAVAVVQVAGPEVVSAAAVSIVRVFERQVFLNIHSVFAVSNPASVVV